MAIDLNWELTILEIVHGFYLNLLRDILEEEVTPPRGLEDDSLRARDRQPTLLLPAMRRWLKLLDMAISPEMLRFSLNSAIDQDLAEALLRYYARKQSKNDSDRDKTDFVVTFLYRNPRVPGQWEKHGLSMDGVAPVPPFEIALLEILDDAALPELSPAESRILDEFEFLAEEVDQIEHFDRLMDSGLMQKARHIKHTFGPAFYHPHALAVIAPLQSPLRLPLCRAFRCRRLPHQVLRRSDSSSSAAASLPGSRETSPSSISPSSRQQTTYDAEYCRAQDHLHHLSRLQKAVDSKNPRPSACRRARLPPPLPRLRPRPASASRPSRPSRSFTNPAQFGEEARIRSVEESIRGWVRAADERCRHIVPMKFGNFVLTPPEADAYCAEFHQEEELSW